MVHFFIDYYLLILVAELVHIVCYLAIAKFSKKRKTEELATAIAAIQPIGKPTGRGY